MIHDTTARKLSYPGSDKQYVRGNRDDLRVPYREIYLSSTHHHGRVQENPPVPVYDTSGPYTDPEMEVIVARGLPRLRNRWIEERGDTERLRVHSSGYARQRQDDLQTLDVRFPWLSKPRRGRDGCNVSQMHYARRGVITPEMEFVALRESLELDRLRADPAYTSLLSQHRGQSFGALIPERITPEFVRSEVAAGRATSQPTLTTLSLNP